MTEKLIRDEFIIKEYDFINPIFMQLQEKMDWIQAYILIRCFSGRKAYENYKDVSLSLEEFGLKRGSNLAKCDLGRSIQAVGASGGSFAVRYLDNITIPNFPAEFMNSLVAIYNSDSELYPTFFDETKIYAVGIFN